jgi:uncharacterized membrane protein YedE/YeeE
MARAALVLLVLALAALALLAAGPRAMLLLLIGVGFGLVLEGLRFGFAGPWRLLVAERDARGFLAQLIAIGATAAVAIPLIAGAGGELQGAAAPVGIAMIAAAFVFGAAMQVVMGCGSGTLVNAGSGNLVGALALFGFIAGSFAGTLHLGAFAALGTLPVITLQGVAGTGGAVALTLAGLALAGGLALRAAQPGRRMPPARLWLAAGLIAALATLNLIVAGQPWGVVYGLGLWGAKIATGLGADLSGAAFWAQPANARRLAETILADVTSVTNIGLIAGAFIVMRWRAPTAQVAPLAPRGWLAVLAGGLVLGYSARLAMGCNVGAFFSGIASGSLHGWVWFAAAFAGSRLGVGLRGRLLVPARTAGAPA